MAYVKEATEEYVEQRIATALSSAMSGMFVVANALPQAGEAGKIYLVPNNGGESGNVRDEYMWVNGAWELIGSTQVDLSGYYDKTAADGRFVQKEAGKGLSANDYTNEDKAKVAAALTAHQDISGKANATDLPYAMVTPGEWLFSGVPSGVTGVSLSWNGVTWEYDYEIGTNLFEDVLPLGYDGTELSLTFTLQQATVTATRASLPGHLLDRAVNAVSVTDTTTLTLPALVNAGKARDFLVRLTVSASSTVTWSATIGETITWDTMGVPPTSFAAGTYLYRFTAIAPDVFHCEDMLALVGLEAALAAINGGVAS